MAVHASKTTSISYLEHWRRWAPVAVLIALCVLVSLFNPNFLTVGNFVRLLNSAAIPVVLCMGATFVILMGSIDLSVEGVVALTAVIASLLVANDITNISIGLAAVPLAVLVGGLMGFLNGFVHVKLKTPSFMTTLGIGFAGLGVATAILGGQTVRIADPTFRFLSLGRILGIPMAVWIALIAFLVALTSSSARASAAGSMPLARMRSRHAMRAFRSSVRASWSSRLPVCSTGLAALWRPRSSARAMP